MGISNIFPYDEPNCVDQKEWDIAVGWSTSMIGNPYEFLDVIKKMELSFICLNDTTLVYDKNLKDIRSTLERAKILSQTWRKRNKRRWEK